MSMPRWSNSNLAASGTTAATKALDTTNPNKWEKSQDKILFIMDMSVGTYCLMSLP